jgi:hypothetical protein
MMEIYMIATPLVTGVFLIGVAMLFQTKNMLSSFIFKLVPMWLGISCLFQGLKTIGWL